MGSLDLDTKLADGAGLEHDFAPMPDVPPPYSEWLLVEARAEVATEGLIGFQSRVWDEAGRVVASGGGQLLCRPRPAGV